MSKICFVIMGFGIKTNPFNGKSLDLDKTYINIIQPAVAAAGMECIRADEIQESSIIDKSMYALLIHADLVIADISAYNPNAIYELGIRHAVRPYATVILKEDSGKIPFDLDHTRIFTYAHGGDDISATEATRCKQQLTSLIGSILEQQQIDSPLYEYIRGLPPMILPEDEYAGLIQRMADKDKYIFASRERALSAMARKDFLEAATFWKKASNLAPNEAYFVQQHALCTYKSKQPSAKTALQEALIIIRSLTDGIDTTDPETLGITGAIYKNLYREDGDLENLKVAIVHYRKCFLVRGDYYTGENYAHCLELQRLQSKDEEERVHLKFEARNTRRSIVDRLRNIFTYQDGDRTDQKWLYATMSNCLLALSENEEAQSYEDKFMQEQPVEWEVETFKVSKQEIINQLN